MYATAALANPHIRASRLWQRSIRFLLVALAIIGVYTNLSLPVGPSRIYGFIGVAAGLALVCIHLLRRRFIYRQMAAFVGICFVVIIFGPDVAEHGLRNALSAGQFLLSVLASLGVASELVHWKPRTLRRLALWAVLLVSGLALLEAAGPLRPASEAFRQAAFSGEDLFLYDSDARDEQLHGGVRPKVFTQEPSHPSKLVAVMLAVWFLLSTSKWRLLGATALFVLAAIALRSPSLIIAPVVIGFAILGKPGATGVARRLRTTLLLALALALCTVEVWVSVLPFERARALAAGDDASSIMRIVAPVAITKEILSNYPLFGLGLGSREVAMPTLISVYASYAAVNIEGIEQGHSALWSNGLFQLICYLGIVGVALLLMWLQRFAGRIYPGDFASVLVCFLAVFSSDGTFGILRPWFYFFVLVAALQLRRQLRPTPQPANSSPQD